VSELRLASQASSRHHYAEVVHHSAKREGGPPRPTHTELRIASQRAHVANMRRMSTEARGDAGERRWTAASPPQARLAGQARRRIRCEMCQVAWLGTLTILPRIREDRESGADPRAARRLLDARSCRVGSSTCSRMAKSRRVTTQD